MHLNLKQGYGLVIELEEAVVGDVVSWQDLKTYLKLYLPVTLNCWIHMLARFIFNILNLTKIHLFYMYFRW